jgi:hypothetical protein
VLAACEARCARVKERLLGGARVSLSPLLATMQPSDGRPGEREMGAGIFISNFLGSTSCDFQWSGRAIYIH